MNFINSLPSDRSDLADEEQIFLFIVAHYRTVTKLKEEPEV